MKHGNRYEGLSEVSISEPNPKRNRKNESTFDDFPNLPKTTISKNPKFITIASADVDKPLSSISIFALRKAIDAISTQYEQVSQLRDGKLLILTKNQKIADKFIAVKNLPDLCPVSITMHNQLNISKGIVYAPWLITVPETEIVLEMGVQNVTEVYKFTKIFDGRPKPTGLMLFTFNTYQPPETVEIGWTNVKVSEYVPNPMRCKNCQILGHTKKRCNNNPMCHICNLPPHIETTCTRTMCANCLAPHQSDSKDCPKFTNERSPQNKN